MKILDDISDNLKEGRKIHLTIIYIIAVVTIVSAIVLFSKNNNLDKEIASLKSNIELLKYEKTAVAKELSVEKIKTEELGKQLFLSQTTLQSCVNNFASFDTFFRKEFKRPKPPDVRLEDIAQKDEGLFDVVLRWFESSPKKYGFKDDGKSDIRLWASNLAQSVAEQVGVFGVKGEETKTIIVDDRYAGYIAFRPITISKGGKIEITGIITYGKNSVGWYELEKTALRESTEFREPKYYETVECVDR